MTHTKPASYALKGAFAVSGIAAAGVVLTAVSLRKAEVEKRKSAASLFGANRARINQENTSEFREQYSYDGTNAIPVVSSGKKG